MLIVKHHWLDRTTVGKSVMILVIFGTLWFLVWRFVCRNGLVLEKYTPFGAGFNPPGMTFCIFGCCAMLTSYGLFTLLEQSRHLSWICMWTEWAGRHTMYIFLYHRLLLDVYLQRYFSNLPAAHIWIARFFFFLFMIFGSMMIETGIRYLQNTWGLRGQQVQE